jgi:ABC-type proline/glycine betaine transport system substrate-binding protein
MKKRNVFLPGLLVVLLAMGLLLAGCGPEEEEKADPVNPFIGTWRSANGFVMVFAASTFTITSAGGSVESGSYTWSGNSASMTVSSGANFGQLLM